MKLARFLLWILWLTSSLAMAGVVKDVEIFKRPDRVDILLAFEQSFSESITQRDGAGYRTIILKNTLYNGLIEETIGWKGIEEVKIFGQESDLYLMIIGAKAPAIEASKTANGFGLRIRLKEMENPAKKSPPATPLAALASTHPADVATEDSLWQGIGVGVFSYQHYLGMMAILLLILFLLLFWRRRLFGGRGAGASWLFAPSKRPLEEVRIRSSKALDMKNRFVMIESHGYRYLILIGAMGNTLIDRYPLEGEREGEEYIEGEPFDRLLGRQQDHLIRYLQDRERLAGELQGKVERY